MAIPMHGTRVFHKYVKIKGVILIPKMGMAYVKWNDYSTSFWCYYNELVYEEPEEIDPKDEEGCI